MDDRRGHETRDFPVGGVVIFAVALVLSAGVIHLALGSLYVGLIERRRARPPAVPAAGVKRQVPPPPRLQQDSRRDLRELRDAERAWLESYGVVDRAAGIFRIPIDRAMERIVERGLPVRKEEER